MELAENPECKVTNLNEIKQEAPEADDVPLQYQKLENVFTDDQLASTSLNTLDADEICNLELKSETVAQDSDEELSVKKELLHEDLDIKSEDETTQETCVDEKHPSEVKPFKCNICDSCFRRKHTLKEHLRTHTGDRPFKCTVCNYSSGHKSNLNRHLLTHTGQKPLKCTVCNYSCGDKSNLKSHFRIHTGQKPYKCDICGFSCIQKGNLKTHLLAHTGEKPFKCTVCDYMTVSNGVLKRHLLTHPGDRPVKCNNCDYRSTKKSSLIRHLRRYHVS